jgi:hypothetical protein
MKMFSAWWFSWYAAGRAENATTNHRQEQQWQWPAGTRATGQRQAKVGVERNLDFSLKSIVLETEVTGRGSRMYPN